MQITRNITKKFLRTGRRAFLLPEMIISVGSGTVILAAIATLAVYSSQSFVAIGNYMDLDRVSRNALDQLTRDIRQTISLNSFATNQLVFTDVNTNTLTYTWNASS